MFYASVKDNHTFYDLKITFVYVLVEFIWTTYVRVPEEAKGHQVTWNWSYKQLVINHLMLKLGSESSARAMHASSH